MLTMTSCGVGNVLMLSSWVLVVLDLGDPPLVVGEVEGVRVNMNAMTALRVPLSCAMSAWWSTSSRCLDAALHHGELGIDAVNPEVDALDCDTSSFAVSWSARASIVCGGHSVEALGAGHLADIHPRPRPNS